MPRDADKGRAAWDMAQAFTGWKEAEFRHCILKATHGCLKNHLSMVSEHLYLHYVALCSEVPRAPPFFI
jgi:hypothetical protein